jgi:hypothetical protein
LNYGFWKKAGLFVVGLVLIPLVIGMTRALIQQSMQVNIPGREGWVFLGGMGLYLVVHLFFWRPITAHVFEHEFTHVVWTWLFGGKVKRFQVSREGGNVLVTKSNILIRLAPYFFPLYAIAIILLYGLIALIAGHHRWSIWCAALLGIAIAFHLAMTAHSLKVEQSDLSGPGYVFSIPFILIMNMLVLTGFLSFFFKGLHYGHFLMDSLRHTGRIWAWLGRLGS